MAATALTTTTLIVTVDAATVGAIIQRPTITRLTTQPTTTQHTLMPRVTGLDSTGRTFSERSLCSLPKSSQK